MASSTTRFPILGAMVEQRKADHRPSLTISVYTALDGSRIDFQWGEFVPEMKDLYDHIIEIPDSDVELHNSKYLLIARFIGVGNRDVAHKVYCHAQTTLNGLYSVHHIEMDVNTLNDLEPLPLTPAIPQAPGAVRWAVWNAIATNLTVVSEGDAHDVPDGWDYGSVGDVTIIRLNMGWGNVTHQLDPQIIFPFWNVWGNLYECAVDENGDEGSPASNTRVHISPAQLWILRTDGSWDQPLRSESIIGESQRENDPGLITSGDYLTLPSGAIAAQTGQHSTAGRGYAFHFQSGEGRVSVGDPITIAGFMLLWSFSLVLHDPLLPDDRATACLLVDIGIDAWNEQNTQTRIPYLWDTPNLDATVWEMGRSANQRLTGDAPKYLSLCSLTEEQIRTNPPPITAIATP